MKPATMANLLRDLAYAYPNTKLPGDPKGMGGTARVWMEALGDLEEQHVVAAVREWIQNEEWFPSPAGIRHKAISLQLGIMPEVEAWSRAVYMVSSRDAKVYEETDSLIRGAVRDAGGARAITEGIDTHRVREAFLKAYRARIQSAYINKGRDNNSLAYRVSDALPEGGKN